jgi:hypothetical protein
MPMNVEESALSTQPVVSVSASDEPMCVLAALIGALTNPDLFDIVVRDGELHIKPA